MKPAEDASLGISQWKAENGEPAVDAISAPVTALNTVRMARRVCLALRGDRVLEVIRMDYIGGLPAFQLLERLAEVFEGWSIQGLDFAGRCRDRDRDGNAFHDQAKTKLM